MQKNLIGSFVLSIAIFGVVSNSVVAQNILENQIGNGSSFKEQAPRESISVFPQEARKGIGQGSLEVEKVGAKVIKARKQPERYIALEGTPYAYVEEKASVKPVPVMNANGPYFSIFVGTPLIAEYKETWEKNSPNNREMDLNYRKPNLFGGIRIGQKFDAIRGEVEASYEQTSFKVSETPYERQLSTASAGFNLLVDVGDFVVRPYVGAGVGYSSIRIKRTGIEVLLTGEEKDSTNSYYVKPIAGISFNIPGGNIFAEASYKIYNKPTFDGYFESPPGIYDPTEIHYKNFGVLGLAGGITFFF